MVLIQFAVAFYAALSSGYLFSGHSSQSLQVGQPADPTLPRYVLSTYSSDYKQARKSCNALYGKNYGLAAIQNQEDLNAVNSFLVQHLSSGKDLWVGGLFLKLRGKWVWDTLIDPTTDESTPFSDYALKLFHGRVPQPPQESMTYYTMTDTNSGVLGDDEPTTTRRFLCENQEGRQEKAFLRSRHHSHSFDNNGPDSYSRQYGYIFSN